MAGNSELVKRVLRCKLQLADTAKSSTVLKVLQKLNKLDITVEVLAETGIGKTVNSFRKHREAGELAKSLVKGWKKLIPKKSTSHTEDGNTSDSFSIKKQTVSDLNSTSSGSQTVDNLSNKCFTSNSKQLTEKFLREEIHEDRKRRKANHEASVEDDPKKLRNGILSLKKALLQGKRDKFIFKHKKNGKGSVDCGGSHLKRKKKPKKKLKPTKEVPQDCNETLSSYQKDLKMSPDLSDAQRDISSSPENRSRKRTKQEKKSKAVPDQDELETSSNKKAKSQHENSENEIEEPSMSFESYLNYDEKALKKNRTRAKKTLKKIKTVSKEQSLVKPVEPQRMPISPKKMHIDSPKDGLNFHLPTLLPECNKAFSFEYLERKVEKEPDFGDLSEDAAVFTGQRQNKKMQVYSGATKTVFLPAMMSLYQQCIRTLQNNINLLYETGGVPFEILEPVLEKCTPEQLLRIEEYNPLYIGVTDHLWGKHCQRDFKDAKLLQYESWKEMYIRLSEEREKKFQTLAKKIVSDHSKKSKGRQVKMAFIHTVAKPPRDVRIQQEIHGTAVQQPQQPRISVKSLESRPRPSNEPVKTSSTTSGPISTQDSRKKTRVAPMMAKSLKAFKKQLGRR
nr:elongin-A-like [Nerophis lumbriciformis]